MSFRLLDSAQAWIFTCAECAVKYDLTAVDFKQLLTWHTKQITPADKKLPPLMLMHVTPFL